jgi:hypothetical protein
VAHGASDPKDQANHEQDCTDGVQDADAEEVPEQQQNDAKNNHETHPILTPIDCVSSSSTSPEDAAEGFRITRGERVMVARVHRIRY